MKTETRSTQLVLWTRAELIDFAVQGIAAKMTEALERVLVRVPETLASKQEAAPAGT
jgi:hypothetical protein